MQDLIESESEQLRIVNASFYPKMDVHAMHREARLTETTQYFSIGEIVDPASKLPNTMPSVNHFREYMKELRVPRDASPIVCYDFTGMFAVARVAWMFRYFGA